MFRDDHSAPTRVRPGSPARPRQNERLRVVDIHRRQSLHPEHRPRPILRMIVLHPAAPPGILGTSKTRQPERYAIDGELNLGDPRAGKPTTTPHRPATLPPTSDRLTPRLPGHPSKEMTRQTGCDVKRIQRSDGQAETVSPTCPRRRASGPTATSQRAPPWKPSSTLGRNGDGADYIVAGQAMREAYASKYSSNSCGCGRSRIGSISLERL
jgi:hypothetical protein